MALPSGNEWLVVLLVIVLLFGAAAIPKLARSLGRAKGEFQKARGEFERELTAGEREAQEEARVRKAARELGVEEQGRPLADVKADLNEKRRD